MGEAWGILGTYTHGESEGIYPFTVDPDEGRFDRGSPVAVDNPSFLAVHPDGETIYAVSETETGALLTLRRRADDGRIRRLSRVETGRSGPCHVGVSPDGSWLAVAHYTGGAVTFHPIDGSGRPSPPADVAEHEGSGPHPDRQRHPHPHAAVPSPDGNFVLVPDLGTDRVVVYDVPGSGLDRLGAVTVTPGSGPRHAGFLPGGRFVLLLNELTSTLQSLEWEPKHGRLRPVDSVSVLPPEYAGDTIAAEIGIHPSGRWVYASNRGHDSLARVALDPATGQLEFRDTVPSGGRSPRHFIIGPTENDLLVANRDSDSVELFEIISETGELVHTGRLMPVPAPACVRFLAG